jgi:hypothetical protein
VLTDIGAVDLAVPRDRHGTFDPKIVRKGQTRLDGFNERIIALYARGMTTRDIRAHLGEIYGVEVSPDLISRVTEPLYVAGSPVRGGSWTVRRPAGAGTSARPQPWGGPAWRAPAPHPQHTSNQPGSLGRQPVLHIAVFLRDRLSRSRPPRLGRVS